jgi:hypothetical protein
MTKALPGVNSHPYFISCNSQASMMIVKPLLIVLFLALAGCGSAPGKPGQFEEQAKTQKLQSAVESPELLPVVSRKYRMVETAKNEWVGVTKSVLR